MLSRKHLGYDFALENYQCAQLHADTLIFPFTNLRLCLESWLKKEEKKKNKQNKTLSCLIYKLKETNLIENLSQ